MASFRSAKREKKAFLLIVTIYFSEAIKERIEKLPRSKFNFLYPRAGTATNSLTNGASKGEKRYAEGEARSNTISARGKH